MAEQTMCVSCGKNPAVSGGDTVPLCGKCGRLAAGKERGVRMTPKRKTKDKLVTR